ncbi:MAG: hypothetical protein L6Q78_13340 [Bacteroidia bacterium]|nr:hypothetical protein [Bacteroidia bacterium]
MAKQAGIIKLEGTIGDISFYKSKNGFIAREKGGIDPRRIAQDPAFKRTRENGKEFGEVAKSSRYIRQNLRKLLQNTADPRASNRLTSGLFGIIKTDTAGARGERRVKFGDLALLKGFNFNEKTPLERTLLEPLSCTIDRSAATCTLSLPAIQPKTDIGAPGGATHLHWLAGVLVFDPDLTEPNVAVYESEKLELSESTWQARSIELTLNPVGTAGLLVVFGLAFSQELNGQFYPMSNGSSNSLAVIEVLPAQN